MPPSRHDVQYATVHGHRRAYVKVGQGPVLLLLHGLGCDHTTWSPVIDALARRYTVLAPDLLGHGLSDKPRADYSVGGYANGMRDLLTVLGVDKVTVVGHSFGGGIAMQFAYQFPERTERLVLVASGGLGPEVSPAIRAITTPGFHQAMGLLTLPGVRHLGVAGLRRLAALPTSATRDLGEVADIYDSFKDPHARAAIRHVVSAVVDWKGQIVTMADRAYLTQAMPMCVVWGRNDQVIPVRHANNAAALAPGARVEVIPNSGHFPHKDHPERFAKIVHDFVRRTQPASYSRSRWRRLLAQAPTGAVAPAAPALQLAEAAPGA
ncbi:4,5:9,10-diseco-3-hydroxy-5,9,17-trioxoandrosta-1(10),2-diene-4-oate hydrolase [Nocardioides dokdonensis FR1436]|uniref:4,5:9,10-diseco-3-hydroxy-5,9, 17-trioxoandrosta-1(10),2-diene-4-oate hydrolase n=1 Tax=Nocardioides dokdonensis FR1436 TaxID=1300347 RepID=A0A1A9GRP6_9ACTN|nr:alpha/beta fold hydrolase [Nocardioides dokdonensis]ANH40121.1 4,5:9,10-diseco-3-hydroxy-5,9,17-trioxoandrosta-1(10),2-diene-4-oate hydrolase [Nocardioides dokdonensis FR1436]